MLFKLKVLSTSYQLSSSPPTPNPAAPSLLSALPLALLDTPPSLSLEEDDDDRDDEAEEGEHDEEADDEQAF